MASRKKKVHEASNHNQPSTLIYCGPNLPKLGLNHGNAFIGGMPAHLQEQFAGSQALQQLFVPAEKLDETLKEITKAGSSYHVWFQEALQISKGGVA
ncbi:hypothetical protein NDK47_09280 [Brevibacillus ruminantium]|uniref:Uncharacterized protein n=1 Tax=Brevibacillus ruminantium TaxID=2950604 RepID=A0ABY4WJX2_9BACL|nr:hypothetical protein [Brevibacillus ruminantium]USG67446.1 hypothetical protein NDK47_09280 [Brevibacillus ruminantium]